jgi:hypothetical protein
MQSARTALWGSVLLFVLPVAWYSSYPAIAQGTSTPQSIEQALISQYALTKATADHSDIVTAGAVLVLIKDGVLMSSTAAAIPVPNTYKDGRITRGFPWNLPNIPNTRKFVTGEKFWVTNIRVQDSGVVFDLFSDPISDVRYYSTLKFPFTKGAYPSSEQAASMVAAVLQVQPTGDAGGGGGGQVPQAAAQQQPPPPSMAPIPPPPPPAKPPALNETREQVIADFGQPLKAVKLGAKEIDYYSSMKVTFVDDKVTDVQ